MQSHISKCWSHDERIANWYENCKFTQKLQTHMKIANVHVGTIHRSVRIANWYQNWKLIWKLQTDMRIAKQFSRFGVLFLRGRLQFSYETQREWTLVLKQKECFRSIAVWMTKTQRDDLSQNLPRFINILIPIPMQTQSDSYLSNDSSALVNPKVIYENFHFTDLATILLGLSILQISITILQRISWQLKCYGRSWPST